MGVQFSSPDELRCYSTEIDETLTISVDMTNRQSLKISAQYL